MSALQIFTPSVICEAESGLYSLRQPIMHPEIIDESLLGAIDEMRDLALERTGREMAFEEALGALQIYE